jgi:hypothetical protein
MFNDGVHSDNGFRVFTAEIGWLTELYVLRCALYVSKKFEYLKINGSELREKFCAGKACTYAADGSKVFRL